MNRSGFAAMFFFFLTCLWIPIGEAGTTDSGIEELFQQGNEAYSRGDYASAVASYEKITGISGYSPGVLLNLANSYAQAGQIGKAILNYERALRLKPSDPDLIGNLQLIIKENGLFPKESTKTEKFFNLLKLNQWTLLILCSLILLALFLFSAMKLRFSRQLTISVSAGCVLVLTLSVYGTFFHYQYFNPSVVTAKDVRLFISPFDSAASSGIVKEGRRVYPHKTHGNFTYVTDETSRKGWIPSVSIESVCKATPVLTE
ncbi:MAG: tetratricopeptide repeat protein [Desulforhopalus sp.]